MDKQQIPQTKAENTEVYVLSKEDSITTIIEKSPRAVQLLAEYGIVCMNCILKQFDNLDVGAQLHGMTEEEIQSMVNEINDVLRKEGHAAK